VALPDDVIMMSYDIIRQHHRDTGSTTVTLQPPCHLVSFPYCAIDIGNALSTAMVEAYMHIMPVSCLSSLMNVTDHALLSFIDSLACSMGNV
jgi:hypothetical protein